MGDNFIFQKEVNTLNIFELLDLENRILHLISQKTRSPVIRGLLQMHGRILSRLSDYSLRDPLTGLFNRNAYAAIMQGLVGLGTTKGDDFSHIILDADHFKEVNDTYGHGIGDKVLKYLADTIQSNLRQPNSPIAYAAILKCETPVRLGGEEIVVLLPSCSAEQGSEKADQLRQGIQNAFETQSGLPKMTVSGGVASFQNAVAVLQCHLVSFSEDELKDSIYVLSDYALYAAKSTGRNRVLSFDDSLSCPTDPKGEEKLREFKERVVLYKTKN